MLKCGLVLCATEILSIVNKGCFTAVYFVEISITSIYNSYQ